MFSPGIEGSGGIRRVPQPVFQKKEVQAGSSEANALPWPQFSDLHGLFEKLAHVPDVRDEKVERVKARLAEGAYSSQESLQRTATAMLEVSGEASKGKDDSQR